MFYQIVIEPLRSLIESQIVELRNRNVLTEKLLNLDDASALRKPRAKERLNELSKCKEKKARVLFCTPELFKHVEDEMKMLVEKRMISLIVVDEFDIIQDAIPTYRAEYLTLVPLLRVVAPNVPLFFLSATFSRKLLAQLIQTRSDSKGDVCKPNLYQSTDPLPRNHVYEGK